MAFRSNSSPHYLRGLRRVLIAVVASVLLLIFLIWRVDNARMEQRRISLVDQFVPSFSWTVKPVAAAARMVSDFRAYGRVYAQNAEAATRIAADAWLAGGGAAARAEERPAAGAQQTCG